jgi:hypothetical protein
MITIKYKWLLFIFIIYDGCMVDLLNLFLTLHIMLMLIIPCDSISLSCKPYEIVYKIYELDQ